MEAEYGDDGVVIVEAQQAVSSNSALGSWVGSLDINSFRTDPQKKVENDYRKTLVIPSMMVFVIIDLTNMKVINPKCGEDYDAARKCIDDNL